MKIATPTSIKIFLQLFKQTAEKPDHLLFVDRERCLTAITQLGLSLEQAIAEIMSISIDDYCEGPESDVARPDEYIWVFGKVISGDEMYIKLKIKTIQGEQYAMCLSFHACDFELKYPHKVGG